MSESEPKTEVNYKESTAKKANDFEFQYNVDHRFLSTITKEELNQANSVPDIIPMENRAPIFSYSNIDFNTYYDDDQPQTKTKGKDERLNQAQLDLIQSMDYTTTFYIAGDILRKDKNSDDLIEDTLICYMSVVPENPVSYKSGQEALISYLQKGSKEVIARADDTKLKPGKISFVVTKEGTIDHVRLTHTSGYTGIDEKMEELIWAIPGEWNIATDARGVKVDQELTFFFGLIGC